MMVRMRMEVEDQMMKVSLLLLQLQIQPLNNKKRRLKFLCHLRKSKQQKWKSWCNWWMINKKPKIRYTILYLWNGIINGKHSLDLKLTRMVILIHQPHPHQIAWVYISISNKKNNHKFQEKLIHVNN